jgi:hypothetical protein
LWLRLRRGIWRERLFLDPHAALLLRRRQERLLLREKELRMRLLRSHRLADVTQLLLRRS